MKHYTFKIHFKNPYAIIEGGSVGKNFEQALNWFKAQPQIQDFIENEGEIDHVELISEEEPEEATPEAAKAKGMESLALATRSRMSGDHRIRVGQELFEARTDCGYSIEYVAEQIGIKPITIQHVEEGTFAADIDLLSRIADFYDCEFALCDKEY